MDRVAQRASSGLCYIERAFWQIHRCDVCLHLINVSQKEADVSPTQAPYCIYLFILPCLFLFCLAVYLLGMSPSRLFDSDPEPISLIIFSLI